MAQESITHRHMIQFFGATTPMELGQAHARRAWLEALESDPGLTGAYVDLGAPYLREGKLTGAWDCFSQARRLNPTHPALREATEIEERLRRAHPRGF